MSIIFRLIRFLVTLAVVAAAVFIVIQMWNVYMLAPWTRDGRVFAQTVVVAPEVSGTIVAVPLTDNELVHKGDVLFRIDQSRFRDRTGTGPGAAAGGPARTEKGGGGCGAAPRSRRADLEGRCREYRHRLRCRSGGCQRRAGRRRSRQAQPGAVDDLCARHRHRHPSAAAGRGFCRRPGIRPSL